jgi:hypothetical protein
MVMMLSLNGVPVYVSGVAGHLAVADRCQLRLHWRIGDFRVSTVGGYVRADEDRVFTTIGSGRYSETIVFRVEHNGWPEGDASAMEIVSSVADDSRNTRAAETRHYAVAEAVARAVAEGRTSDEDIAAAVREAT